MIYGTEKFGQVRMVYTGDKTPLRESVVVISNHYSYADWMIIFTFAKRMGRLGCCKFFVKDLIKWIPGIGWGLVISDSIFLKRDWTRDERTIRGTFAHLREHNLPFWLVLFVEGTRITPKKHKEGQEFSRKQGLPVLNHLLVPRTKGLYATLLALGDAHVDAVYDLTIGYPNLKAPTVAAISGGCVDVTVHLHVRRYPVKDIPRDEKALAAWCMKVWETKDQLLEHFHKHGHFPGPKLDLPHERVPMLLSEFEKKASQKKSD
jgi:1-acyl-sn-glycerol-3-phosphate acyltransferase